MWDYLHQAPSAWGHRLFCHERFSFGKLDRIKDKEGNSGILISKSNVASIPRWHVFLALLPY